jgi:hypothetical protein
MVDSIFGGGTYSSLDNSDNPWNGDSYQNGGGLVHTVADRNGNVHGMGGSLDNPWSDVSINRDAKTYQPDDYKPADWDRTMATSLGKVVGGVGGSLTPVPGGRSVGSSVGGWLAGTLYDGWGAEPIPGLGNPIAGDPTERDERGGLGAYAGDMGSSR